MTTDVDIHPSRFLSVEAICSSKHNKKNYTDRICIYYN